MVLEFKYLLIFALNLAAVFLVVPLSLSFSSCFLCPFRLLVCLLALSMFFFFLCFFCFFMFFSMSRTFHDETRNTSHTN